MFPSRISHVWPSPTKESRFLSSAVNIRFFIVRQHTRANCSSYAVVRQNQSAKGHDLVPSLQATVHGQTPHFPTKTYNSCHFVFRSLPDSIQTTRR